MNLYKINKFSKIHPPHTIPTMKADSNQMFVFRNLFISRIYGFHV